MVYILSRVSEGGKVYTRVTRSDRLKDHYCETYDLPLERVRQAMIDTGVNPARIGVGDTSGE